MRTNSKGFSMEKGEGKSKILRKMLSLVEANQLFLMIFGEGVSKDVLARWSNQGIRLMDDKNECINSTIDHNPKTCMSDCGKWNFGFSKHDGILEQDGLAAPEKMWIKLVYSVSETVDERVLVIPKLDHLHLNSQTVSDLDFHVISYKVPTFGGHHYSLGSSSSLIASPCKKLKWFNDLYEKAVHLDWPMISI